jgi:DNA-binding beta-propeller fold protein YncE
MPLTTVARGRVYEWSHAVGRGAQSGTGFNYPQTMCLAKGGVAYVANRGNENNFGMRVNEVKIGGPGEEELLAEFFQWGEGDGRSTWPFGVAADDQDRVYVSDEWNNTVSVFDNKGKFLRKWGKTGGGDGELLRPAGWRARRTVTSSSWTVGTIDFKSSPPRGSFWRSVARPGEGTESSTSPGASPSIGPATSTSRTGRIIASRSCPLRASS